MIGRRGMRPCSRSWSLAAHEEARCSITTWETEWPVRSVVVAGPTPYMIFGAAAGEVRLVPLRKRQPLHDERGCTTGGILLPSHTSAVTALAACLCSEEGGSEELATYHESLLVCSASRAAVSLSRVRLESDHGNSDCAADMRHQWSLTLTSMLAQRRGASTVPACAAFESSGRLVAVAASNVVLILRTGSGSLLARLEGHSGDVRCCCFDPSKPHVLATGAEDGGLKLWNLEARSCVWNASCESPCAALAFHPLSGALCVAGCSGHVALYRSAQDGDSMIEVSSFSRRRSHEVPAAVLSGDRPEREARLESAPVVLALTFTKACNESCVLIATSDGLWVVNCMTRQWHQVHEQCRAAAPFSYAALDWQSPVGALASASTPSLKLLTIPDHFPHHVTSTALSNQARPGTRPGSSSSAAAAVSPTTDHRSPPAAADPDSTLSFFPSHEVPENSPLRADFLNRVKSTVKTLAYDSVSSTPTRRNGPGLPADKPVVFHRKIRSSGYGSMTCSWGDKPGTTKPRSKPCTPSPSPAAKTAATAKIRHTSPGGSSTKVSLLRQYPSDCGPLTRHQPSNDPSNTNADPAMRPALLALAYFEDAQSLATAAVDGTVHFYKLPIAKHRGEGVTLVGHTAAARSVCPSHDNNMLLTASDDGTARLWALNLSRKSPAVIIKPPGLQVPVPQASFFYLDKFALVASGRFVHLVQYQIDLLPKDALIRQPTLGKTRISHSFEHQHAHKVVSFVCLNSMLSPLVVSACSDRSLCVLDAAKGTLARVMFDVHAKPIHTVALPRPTVYSDVPKETLEVFATAATDNVITVWDLRADIARAATFREGHLNRREKVGLAFSPCMRYLTAGSEDRATCVYDLRTGRALHRLQGHDDVVSAVAFNPLHAQLATASYDGRVRFYTEERQSTPNTSRGR